MMNFLPRMVFLGHHKQRSWESAVVESEGGSSP